jgi:hypothetical protein
VSRRRFPIRSWYPSQHLLRQNPPPRSQFGSRRGCPAQHELPAARDGAGNPIEVVGAWSDVTARKQLAEALAAAQERLVHLLSCDIECEPAGVAQLAAAGSSLDRHEIAARPATSASDQRPRKHPGGAVRFKQTELTPRALKGRRRPTCKRLERVHGHDCGNRQPPSARNTENGCCGHGTV